VSARARAEPRRAGQPAARVSRTDRLGRRHGPRRGCIGEGAGGAGESSLAGDREGSAESGGAGSTPLCVLPCGLALCSACLSTGCKGTALRLVNMTAGYGCSEDGSDGREKLNQESSLLAQHTECNIFHSGLSHQQTLHSLNITGKAGWLCVGLCRGRPASGLCLPLLALFQVTGCLFRLRVI
jgi:hypothetical protein